MWQIVLRWLARMCGKSDSRDVHAAIIRRLCPTCPVCGAHLGEHASALLAIQDGSNPAAVTRFLKSVAEHDWQAVSRFQAFSDADLATADVIRCPKGSAFVMVMRSPAELYESESLLDLQVLSGTEHALVQRLLQGLGQAWTPL